MNGKKQRDVDKTKAQSPIEQVAKSGAKKLSRRSDALPIKRKLRAAKQAAKNNAVKENRLELLFTIVNRSKAEYYVDLLHSFDVNMQIIALGQGTANASTMAYFGLDDLDKAVILSVINETKINDALGALEDKFAKIKNGKGIAYTVPLDGVIGTLIYGFLSNNRKTVKDNANKENKA